MVDLRTCPRETGTRYFLALFSHTIFQCVRLERYRLLVIVVDKIAGHDRR